MSNTDRAYMSQKITMSLAQIICGCAIIFTLSVLPVKLPAYLLLPLVLTALALLFYGAPMFIIFSMKLKKYDNDHWYEIQVLSDVQLTQATFYAQSTPFEAPPDEVSEYPQNS